MHENVAELVADQYRKNNLNANGTPTYNLTKTSAGSPLLVPIRGGSFSTSKTNIDVALRENTSTSNKSNRTGFRLVLNFLEE